MASSGRLVCGEGRMGCRRNCKRNVALLKKLAKLKLPAPHSQPHTTNFRRLARLSKKQGLATRLATKATVSLRTEMATYSTESLLEAAAATGAIDYCSSTIDFVSPRSKLYTKTAVIPTIHLAGAQRGRGHVASAYPRRANLQNGGWSVGGGRGAFEVVG